MERTIQLFAKSPWARVGVIAAVLLVLGLTSLDGYQRSVLGLKLAQYSPIVLIPLGVGAAVGWLAYSWKVFWATTASVFAVVCLLVVQAWRGGWSF